MKKRRRAQATPYREKKGENIPALTHPSIPPRISFPPCLPLPWTVTLTPCHANVCTLVFARGASSPPSTSTTFGSTLGVMAKLRSCRFVAAAVSSVRSSVRPFAISSVAATGRRIAAGYRVVAIEILPLNLTLPSSFFVSKHSVCRKKSDQTGKCDSRKAPDDPYTSPIPTHARAPIPQPSQLYTAKPSPPQSNPLSFFSPRNMPASRPLPYRSHGVPTPAHPEPIWLPSLPIRDGLVVKPAWWTFGLVENGAEEQSG